ncbi:MAG: InlB B-repeat-containing protein [Chitinispirillales bacterium]|jgi:uncharacterized repeat protein (TIGR02543 family)|nr:InlB B-repeat-containing protein [Chitinispirillales bacterium]
MRKQTVLWAVLFVTMWTWTAVGQVRTITLNHNYTGGPGNITRATDTHGNLMGEPLPTPTREGFIFNGWFLTQSGGSVTGKNRDRVLVGATGTRFTQNTTIYARWSAPNAIQASSMSQIPAAFRENFDWLRNTRHAREPVLFNRNNLVWDQVFHGGGTINWAIRWESDRVVTLAERREIARLLHEEINKWTRPLIGMPGWPFQEIPVTVVGWAVSNADLIQDRQPNETIWVNNDHRPPLGIHNNEAFMASAPNNISRFNNFNAVNNGTFTYTGGLHARFDMYLWCTRNFGGGAGGDWGSRQSDMNVINAAAANNATAFGNTGIITHEVGHAFGLYDFYGGIGTDRPPATTTADSTGNTSFGSGALRTIMHVGGGAPFTAPLSTYDQWQIRYYWDWIRTAAPASRFRTYTVAVNGTGTGAMGGGINYPAHYAVSISAGTRSGYTFSGWTSTTTGVTFASANNSSTTFIMPASNVTVTANWTAEAITHTLTIARNPSSVGSTINVSGTAYTAARTVNANTAIPITTTVPAGFTFTNWTVTSGSSNATLANASSATNATVTLTGNATVTANYAPVTYTIAFNANGGTGTMTSDNVTHGSDYTIKANTFTRTGYTFTGWRTGASSGARHAADAQITNVTGNITLFAQWSINTYTVTFMDGHSTGDEAIVVVRNNVNHGTAATAPDDPTRTGYAFDGWDIAFANVTGDLTVTARWTTATSAMSYDRATPDPQLNEVVFVPLMVFAGEFAAGPNPASRASSESNAVNFFWQGGKIDNAVLTIFDASGRVVNRITIADRGDGSASRRVVGTWDLTDNRGRPVPEGTYLVRGVITAPNGNRERVSLAIGVR